MNLVAFVGKDKESWGQITALINRMECEKVILVANKEAETLPANGKCSLVKVDSGALITDLKKEIIELVKPKLEADFEVAVSLASGTGKEHMALLSALLSIPVGIRLVAYTKQGVEVIT